MGYWHCHGWAYYKKLFVVTLRLTVRFWIEFMDIYLLEYFTFIKSVCSNKKFGQKIRLKDCKIVKSTQTLLNFDHFVDMFQHSSCVQESQTSQHQWK